MCKGPEVSSRNSFVSNNSFDYVIHKCPECPQSFRLQSLMRRHLARAHNSFNLVKCPECFQEFTDPIKLGNHLVSHFSDRPFQCSDCRYRFRTSYHLRRHGMIHKSKQFSCPKCEIRFRDLRGMQRHQSVHSIDKNFQCSMCPVTYKTLYSLNLHLRKHFGQTPFACDHCGKRFADRGSLSKHVVCHSDFRPFACNLCGFRFKRIWELKNHAIVHTDLRPHSCTLCSHTFKYKKHLTKHLLHKHAQGAGPPKKTSLDPNYFTSPSVSVPTLIETTNIKIEKEISSLDPIFVPGVRRSFQCSECGEVFGRRSDWLRHFRTHRGWMPYKCSECKQNFGDSRKLREHLIHHTIGVIKQELLSSEQNLLKIEGQNSSFQFVNSTEGPQAFKARPYLCTECGQKFNKSTSLMKHLLRHLGRNTNV